MSKVFRDEKERRILSITNQNRRIKKSIIYLEKNEEKVGF